MFRGGADLIKTVDLVRELGPVRALERIRSIALHRLHAGRLERKLIAMDGYDTPGEIPLSAVTTVGSNRDHGVNYVPTPSRVFERLLAELPIAPADFSFVDFGCGTGRLLLLAAEHGFRRALGVEFAVELAERARARIAAYAEQAASSPDIVCHLMDAADFTIPDGPCVVFLFNPFSDEVLSRVIRNIEDSHRAAPREIYVIYYHPACPHLFDDSSLFQRRTLSFATRLYLAALSPYGATLYQSRT